MQVECFSIDCGAEFFALLLKTTRSAREKRITMTTWLMRCPDLRYPISTSPSRQREV